MTRVQFGASRSTRDGRRFICLQPHRTRAREARRASRDRRPQIGVAVRASQQCCEDVATSPVALAGVCTVVLLPLGVSVDAWLRPRQVWARTSRRRWVWGTLPAFATLSSFPLDTFAPSLLGTVLAALYLGRVRPMLTVAAGLDRPQQTSRGSSPPSVQQEAVAEVLAAAVVLTAFVVFAVMVHRDARELVGGLVMALSGAVLIAARVVILLRRR